MRKPHPRLRRAALVSGAGVSVLLVAVWITSMRLYFLGWASNSLWGIGNGQVFVMLGFSTSDSAARQSFRLQMLANARQSPGPIAWWFAVTGEYVGFIGVPLWFPAALSLLGTAAVWRLDARARRRARVGKCAKCGYDRAGLAPASPCPECGTNPGCGGGQP